jgi:hypothetical protein
MAVIVTKFLAVPSLSWSGPRMARADLSLRSVFTRNRIPLPRMEIRRAFESCCTPAAEGFDCLCSAVQRTKRDLMQSSQMIQYSDLPADFEGSDRSGNMFEVGKPRAVSFR